MSSWFIINGWKFTYAERELYVINNESFEVHAYFRSTEWKINTNSNEIPKFYFDIFPGIDCPKKDTINMSNLKGENIKDSELINSKMGSYSEKIFTPNKVNSDVKKMWNNYRMGVDTLFSNYYVQSTGHYIWGPINIFDNSKKFLLTVASDNKGNQIEYKNIDDYKKNHLNAYDLGKNI